MGYLPELHQWVNTITAAATMTSSVAMINFDCGSVQVIWDGFDDNDATFKLRATNKTGSGNDLEGAIVTMLSANTSQVFNITDAGYSELLCEYQPGSVTTGTIEVVICRKSRK